MKSGKWVFISLVLLIGGAVACGLVMAQKKLGEADEITAPKEVRVALRRAAEVYPRPLKGARWTTVAKLQGSDHCIYQVRGKNDRGATIEIEITSAGRIVEVEEHGIP